MIQEKEHKEKKPSAMAQVHNKVNAGIMDAVTCGGMCEAAEPEDEEYELGLEDGGLEPYGHVNEATDCIPYYNLVLEMDNAYPFITFTKKDGTDTETFVGESGEEHNAMPAKLLSDKKIKKEDFGNSLWDIKRDEYRSGRIWFLENGRIFVSFYSYRRNNYSAMYKDVVETLLQVKEKLGLNFNIGKVIIDFWTFNWDDNIFVPVRWLSNGVAEAYFKYMTECVPVGGDSFKLKTARGNFVLDWEGNETESINENKGKKTIYITEGQMKTMQTLLENEGTNLKKARNFLKAQGYDEGQRQQLLDKIRHDIPNSRLRDCKFVLGVARLTIERQLNDGRSVMSLNQVLKYIAMDSHVNEYDNNLNGENLDTLVSRFSSVAASDLQQSMQASNSRELTANQNYKIIPIDSPEEAAEYADYVDWCVTYDEDAYNSYTSDGLGRFYFCLRNDFETVEREKGEGCPLDDYGLSMIAVSVNDDGSLNTVTCRWNHDAGGSDNVMSLEQLETILGRNFYQTFKPYTKEELRAKGLTPFSEIPELLAAGVEPKKIFKDIEPFGEGFMVAAGGKNNIIKNVNGRYELVFEKWFSEAFLGTFESTLAEQDDYALVKIDDSYNYLLTNYSFLLDKFVLYAEPFANGYGKIYEGGRTNPKMNLVKPDGSFVFPNWIDPKTDFTFDEVDGQGNLIVNKFFGNDINSENEYDSWLYNIISVKNPGQFLCDKWYKTINETDWFYWGDERVRGYFVKMPAEENGSAPIRNVLLPDGTPILGKYGFPVKVISSFGHVMFILKNESVKIFSTVTKKFTPWFDEINAIGGYGTQYQPIRVKRGNKVNYLDRNGDFLSEVFFDDGGLFTDSKNKPKLVMVRLNGRVNFMNENGEMLSNTWFKNAGKEWATDDFWNHDERKRILVQTDDNVWHKLYEDGELAIFDPHGMMSSNDYDIIHGYGSLYESRGGEKQGMTGYEKYIRSFIDFLRSQHLNIDPLPEIEFKSDEQEGLFIKTGYYSPDERKVVVYTDGRHPKDIMRTVAHEFVHHMQNLQNPNKDWGTGGNLEDDKTLRGIEGEAFLLGNIIFREWTEYVKKNEKSLNESRLSESPDSIYSKDLFYRDEEAIPFMLSKEDGEFYVGYGGQTHIEMMAEHFDKDKGELYSTINDDTFGNYVDVESTGRYWPEENIISFWKTPLGHKEKLLNVINRLSSYASFDFKHLVIDWWDNDSHSDSEIPYRWLVNGTFYMFYDKGIESITRDSNDVFTVIMRNGQRYNFDFDGNFASPAYSYSYGLYESKKRKKQIKNDKGEIVPEKCDKCGGKVVCQIHGEPVYVCKECGKYFGTVPFPGHLNESINVKKALKDLKKRRDPGNIENWDSLNEIASEIVEPDDVDLSSFNIKKHLNPKFWDDGHLDTRIRLKLLDIADDFFDSLGIDWVEPEDVIITGSLANYNWNDKYSDIDLHILVDYEDVDERIDFVREYFTLKKNEWNQKHKGLKIFGFPVEVYVQDANEAHASSGVYSIDRDEWITEPDREKIRSGKVSKKHIREMISTYMNKIDCLIDIYKHHKDDKHEMEQVAKDAAEMLDEIKAVRKEDLAKYGREMCDGNIIFKALRRADYIGKLIKLKNLAYDKINSL